ncbi:hypothetical protein [Anabaena sp. AL09]|jgi:hypothetical protein|uniref:hypothetical protein n=1 Tax=Anabaena sp. AL09 TaxID=1710891 RepID=UPI0007FBF42E|nr:hypothetical protein [Anabaena sp. AL09]MBS9385153.1 hypothetical protein [Dolichospermum sp. BR01]OBQ09096.1 MAG: hypothetical protein AN490_09305 [Anabaena sp. AL09]
MTKKLTGLEILNDSDNIVAVLVYITNQSIEIKDIIIDSEINELEDIEDTALSKWGMVDITEEIEYEKLYIFAKVAVGPRTKDYAYWSAYEAEMDFETIKESVQTVIALQAESKKESEHKQQKLFNLDDYL